MCVNLIMLVSALFAGSGETEVILRNIHPERKPLSMCVCVCVCVCVECVNALMYAFR